MFVSMSESRSAVVPDCIEHACGVAASVGDGCFASHGPLLSSHSVFLLLVAMRRTVEIVDYGGNAGGSVGPITRLQELLVFGASSSSHI